MLRTNDGYRITEGMWISSPDLVCEVKEVHDNKLYAREIIFDGDNSFHHGDVLTITKNDLHHYCYN